jgi:hypothetical protein
MVKYDAEWEIMRNDEKLQIVCSQFLTLLQMFFDVLSNSKIFNSSLFGKSFSINNQCFFGFFRIFGKHGLTFECQN